MASSAIDGGYSPACVEKRDTHQQTSLELLAEMALLSPYNVSSSSQHASPNALKRKASKSPLEGDQPPTGKFKLLPTSDSSASTGDSEETAVSSSSSVFSLSHSTRSPPTDRGEAATGVELFGVEEISDITDSELLIDQSPSSLAAQYISRQELHCLGWRSNTTTTLSPSVDHSPSVLSTTESPPEINMGVLLDTASSGVYRVSQLGSPSTRGTSSALEVQVNTAKGRYLESMSPESHLMDASERVSEFQGVARVSTRLACRGSTRGSAIANPPVQDIFPSTSVAPRPLSSSARKRSRSSTKQAPQLDIPSSPSFQATAPVTPSTGTIMESDGSYSTIPDTTIVQTRRCISIKTGHHKCVSCLKRKRGDTCRFWGIRAFPGGVPTRPTGESFLVDDCREPEKVVYPNRWNVNLTGEMIKRLRRVVAKSLVGVLEMELGHLQLPGVIVRNRELECRATCDCCMTSLFTSCWICQDCGRELCSDCHDEVSRISADLSSLTEVTRRKQPLKMLKEDEGRMKRVMICSFGEEHPASRFQPISRFRKGELQSLLDDMKTVIADESLETSRNLPLESVGHISEPSTSHIAPTDPEDPSGVGSLPVHVFASDSFDENTFSSLWAQGKAIVVTNLLHKFQLKWTPEAFISQYGSQKCEVVECSTNDVRMAKVGDFFEKFGTFEGREGCLKLKDWPPMSDFAKEFPSLFEDFARAVPIPNYTRRDGALNIASHFPTNAKALVPDIGPKMYNAFESSELSGGSKGSTRLHMDMADAVNIMMFASPRNCEGSPPGVAAWDIFPAEDTAKIRKFLKDKFGESLTDPIHSLEHYLDSELRKELWEKEGVKSWRIYQKPGEAVFIPAGCAHQVCNLADCIKIAVDFVSPENVDRCEKLTREFREQNQSLAWKDDVLQLKMTMLHAWNSLTQVIQSRSIGEASQGSVDIPTVS